MNYVKGNLFDHVKSGIIVHSCNAQQVMGSGFAKEFKAKYPSAFEKYCRDLNKGYKLGDVSWGGYDNVTLASLIGQEFYGRDSDTIYTSYDAINKGLDEVFRVAKSNNLSVSMPKLGSGLGGGDWSIIEAIIKSTTRKNNFLENLITVYEL